MAEIEAALTALVARIGGQPRPGQVQMALAVDSAIRTKHHLLVQAGTGTGKSFAYLVPAAMRSVADNKRVLVSTATLALQRQLMAKDVPTVLAAISGLLPRPPRAALLKGRGNYLCKLRLQEAAAPDSDGLFELTGRLERQASILRTWAQETNSGDRDDLAEPIDQRVWRAMSVSGSECVGRQRCPVGADCFAEVARDLAQEADIVVTNHALLAIDAVGGRSVLPEPAVVVVDEAHELAARFTQASTQTLTVAGLGDGLRLAGGLVRPETAAACANAAEQYRHALSEAMPVPAPDHQRITEPGPRLVAALAVLRDSHHRALTELNASGEEGQLSRRQAALGAMTEVHDCAGKLLAGDSGLVRWASSEPLGLTVAPLSVAGQLRGQLLAEATVVATSATMQLGGSFTQMAGDWGLRSGEGANYEQLDVGSPFDYRRQGILYLPSDLGAPTRDGIGGPALDRIAELIRAAGGRTLVLASSWRSVEAIGDYLRVATPQAQVLVQRRGEPVAALVAAFAAEERSVLVGTLSLWQGVDVPGRSCTCVIIEKIPFPRPDDPVLSARADQATAQGRSGFAAVSLPHAALLLAQGSGRLIRTSTDRGVVAILDPRVATRGYGRYLVDSLPNMWRTSRTDVVLAALERLRDASDLTQHRHNLAEDAGVIAVDGLV